MAVRSRYVEPDQVRETADGPLPYVTDEAYFNALLAVAQVQAVAGGIVTAVVQRAPTGIPNEMVTTSALVEWRDRTDAKPQPERSVQITPPDEQPAPQPGLFESTEDEPSPGVVVDEFDEEEDVSAIPEHARS
jgi:hypothetical protein